MSVLLDVSKNNKVWKDITLEFLLACFLKLCFVLSFKIRLHKTLRNISSVITIDLSTR